MKRFYHYTTELRLQEIIDSKKINVAIASITHKKEKPVAWVSTNENWENTATKMAVTELGESVQLTFEQQFKNFGCARIQVKNKGLFTWAKLKYKANMDIKFFHGMEETGKALAAKPEEWYGSLKSIPSEDWLNIQVYRDGKWVDFN